MIGKLINEFKHRGFGGDMNLLESVLRDDDLVEAERLATEMGHEYNADLPDIRNGYLLPYMHGQAIWRTENQSTAPNMERLEKSIELCRESIDLKGDFADSHFILGLALYTKAAVQKIDDDVPDEWSYVTLSESSHHLSEAVKYNPQFQPYATEFIHFAQD